MNLFRTLRRIVPQRHPIRLAWHRMKASVAALVYLYPARRLTVIAVTGTDGKTTTVGMILHILRAEGIHCGALSTAFMDCNGNTQWNATQKTSPSPFTVQRFLRRLVRAGCTHAILEASSHGLVQGRLNFTWPLIGAVTNVTPEHLDYHGTLEQYRRDKGLLFAQLRLNGTKVLNMSDASFSQFAGGSPHRLISYSEKEDADLWRSDAKAEPHGIEALIHIKGQPNPLPLRLALPGEFNLDNALCALGCTMALGVAPGNALQALAKFPGVPGRMERIDEGQGFSVYVDFTVTPAAYEKTLSTLRGILGSQRRILVLTGSCGDRMREKRAPVGRICSRLADVVVVTNEDPYTEDPERIIDEVWAGIDQSACQAMRISDRREAMRWIFSQARAEDAVLLCAKGSDTTMMTARGQIPWNEREIARELLRPLKKNG